MGQSSLFPSSGSKSEPRRGHTTYMLKVARTWCCSSCPGEPLASGLGARPGEDMWVSGYGETPRGVRAVASPGLPHGMSLVLAGLCPARTSHPRERSESRKQAGGEEGERSPGREVRQFLESAALAQFKWPERSSEKRGLGWAAAARGVNVPAAFPSVCLCHLPTISYNLSPQEPAISHSAA